MDEKLHCHQLAAAFSARLRATSPTKRRFFALAPVEGFYTLRIMKGGTVGSASTLLSKVHFAPAMKPREIEAFEKHKRKELEVHYEREDNQKLEKTKKDLAKKNDRNIETKIQTETTNLKKKRDKTVEDDIDALRYDRSGEIVFGLCFLGGDDGKALVLQCRKKPTPLQARKLRLYLRHYKAQIPWSHVQLIDLHDRHIEPAEKQRLEDDEVDPAELEALSDVAPMAADEEPALRDPNGTADDELVEDSTVASKVFEHACSRARALAEDQKLLGDPNPAKCYKLTEDALDEGEKESDVVELLCRQIDDYDLDRLCDLLALEAVEVTGSDARERAVAPLFKWIRQSAVEDGCLSAEEVAVAQDTKLRSYIFDNFSASHAIDFIRVKSLEYFDTRKPDRGDDENELSRLKLWYRDLLMVSGADAAEGPSSPVDDAVALTEREISLLSGADAGAAALSLPGEWVTTFADARVISKTYCDRMEKIIRNVTEADGAEYALTEGCVAERFDDRAFRSLSPDPLRSALVAVGEAETSLARRDAAVAAAKVASQTRESIDGNEDLAEMDDPSPDDFCPELRPQQMLLSGLTSIEKALARLATA